VVKDGNNPPVGLAAATWGIDWTMTVDPVLHTGTGAAGAQPQTVPADSVRPGAGLTHTDAQQWAAPVNDAEADAMALGDLLRSLPAARQYDLAAYHRMVGAIHRRNNPACFHASVKVDEDDNLFGSDTIEVSMEGVRGPKPKPPQKAGTGDNFMLDWQLYDLFDPHDITQGSRIKVTIARQGEKAQERSWVFRWGDTDALLHKFPGDSKYRLSMMLR
jgi:hypothetical protein